MYVYVCMYVCMYFCMRVCLCVRVCIYILMYNIYIHIDSALESFTSWHLSEGQASDGNRPSLDAASLLPSVLCALEMALVLTPDI